MNKPLKILLVNPENIDRNKRVMEMTPYAGLAYIAAYMERAFGGDISVEIIEMLPQRLRIEDVAAKARSEHYDICGITSKTFNYIFARKLADAIKASCPETLVVFGGAHATALPEEVVSHHSTDAVVVQEGEIAVTNIIENLLGGSKPFEDVKGVFHKTDGEIVNNGPAELIKDLDELPVPDWGRHYDFKNYGRLYDDHTGKFNLMIPVFASRGCPFSCNFCQPVLTRRNRVRSVGNVIDEVRYLAGRYKIKRVYFEDSVFGMRREWFMDFCRQYMARGLHKTISWGFETNVNYVDAEKMNMAREAGCVYVYYGIESISDEVQRDLGKNASREKIENAIEAAKKAGIREVAGSIILGLPYETSRTARETLDFIEHSSLDRININLLDVYPGTRLYDMVESGTGGISWIPEKKDKWDECGITLVKTFVNDLDSVEKLEGLYLQALQILHKKYRKSYYRYIVKSIRYVLFYTSRNPRFLKNIFKRTVNAYLPGFLKFNE